MRTQTDPAPRDLNGIASDQNHVKIMLRYFQKNYGFPMFRSTQNVQKSIFAPPGATFQINVRPPLRMVSGVSASAKNAFDQMLVAMVWGCRSGARCCPSVWEVTEVCCEGFRRDFGCAPIGCSSDGSISMLITRKSQRSQRSAKIPIHPGFPWFFMVLSAINLCKRFLLRLRFA